MHKCFLTVSAILVALTTHTFAMTDAELKAQYERNIAALTPWVGNYNKSKTELCNLAIRKSQTNVDACVAGFDMLVSRIKTEINYNQLRLTALTLDTSSRREVLDSFLPNITVDDFNKETRRLAGWVEHLYPAPSK